MDDGSLLHKENHRPVVMISCTKDNPRLCPGNKVLCQYCVVFVPKYCRLEIYGEIKADIGKILQQLCQQKEWE